MNAEAVFSLLDQTYTEHLAEKLSTCLPKALIMTFKGEIGTGKTTFIRALLRSLGVTSAIKSPTFSLVESYQHKNLQIHHFDLYRIYDTSELDYLGFRDFFSGDALCCIEWPEHAGDVLTAVDLQFFLAVQGDGRTMLVKAKSAKGMAVLSCLRGEA